MAPPAGRHCFQTVHTVRGDVRGVAVVKPGTELEFCFREADFSLPKPEGFEPILAERNIL